MLHNERAVHVDIVQHANKTRLFVAKTARFDEVPGEYQRDAREHKHHKEGVDAVSHCSYRFFD